MCCPKCGSTLITHDRLESDAAQAWGEVTCKECGAEWVDVYALIGYEAEEGSCTDFTGAVSEGLVDDH